MFARVKHRTVQFLFLSGRSIFVRHSCSKLFVGGLSYDTNEPVLKEAFEEFGELIEVKVICDHKSGKSKGYGFVNYTSEASANTALKQMDGKMGDIFVCIMRSRADLVSFLPVIRTPKGELVIMIRRSIVSLLVREKLRALTSLRKGYCGCVSSATESAEVPDFDDDRPLDNSKLLEKDSQLHQALSSLSGDFCNESKLSMHRFFTSRRAPVISTGSLRLDEALGVGGLPKGRMVEIYGKEASGKTTLSLHVIKEAQKKGGYCAYLDVENALDLSLVKSMGVNTEKLLISTPRSAEQVLSVVNTLTMSGSLDVIVVDSVAALVPQRELDASIDQLHRDFQAETMTRALRKIHHSLSRSETLIIFINQVRHKVKPELGYGHAEEVTCGGSALRFYAAVRLKISRMHLMKLDDVATGLSICVDVVKNKLAPAAKRVELEIEFGRGLRNEAEVLKLASEKEIILNEGGSYFIEGEVLHCESDAEQYLRDNEDVLEIITAKLRSQLFGEKMSS